MDGQPPRRDSAGMTEEGPLVDRTTPAPPPSELTSRPAPRRPITTIVVVVAITVLATGILTGRIDPGAGGTWVATGRRPAWTPRPTDGRRRPRPTSRVIPGTATS